MSLIELKVSEINNFRPILQTFCFIFYLKNIESVTLAWKSCIFFICYVIKVSLCLILKQPLGMTLIFVFNSVLK